MKPINNEKFYQLALVLTPGVGNVLAKYLVSYSGSAESVFKNTKSKLLKIPNIGEMIAENILRKDTLQEAEKQLELSQEHDYQILFYTDPDYPERLKTIADAPVLFYLKGSADLNAAKVVSIVGTRNATAYGKSVTEEIVENLAKYESLLIVSGLAYGIDIAAHKTALKLGIPTLGVMATGIDSVYPSGHSSIAKQMLELNGGLLTEYKHGTKADPAFFPSRNRIIAGMCDAVIVVEAGSTGGALITAEIANGYNKDVFAIPGNLHSKYSEGCNNLIRNHKANIYTKIEDLEYIMNWDWKGEGKRNIPENGKSPKPEIDNLNPDEQKIVWLLEQNKEMQLDVLSWKSQISVNILASVLLNLELQGFIKALPGKKFTLVN